VKIPSFDVEELGENTWRLSKRWRFQGPMIQKKIPNKKDCEGGPGRLSSADLIKKRRSNFHKAYEIA
jgi:hypothetical protein